MPAHLRNPHPRPPDRYVPRDPSLIIPAQGRIKLTLAELAVRKGFVGKGKYKGYPSLQAILRGSGISYERLYHMLRRPDAVHHLTFGMLLKLCSFFDCQPGDLLHYDRFAPDLGELPVQASFRSEEALGFIKEEEVSSVLVREPSPALGFRKEVSSALARESPPAQPGLVSPQPPSPAPKRPPRPRETVLPGL